MAYSTANWHWKNKNITRWAKEWFDQELTSIIIPGEKEGEEVSITEVTEMDGDVELGSRKSKLITIFDCKVSLKWAGKTSDGTEVAGSLLIPEVSHEIICDNLSDFVYNWSLSTESSPEVNAIYAFAKSRLPTAIETKLATLPGAIIDSHGRDLTVSADPSRTGTPVPTTAPPTASASSTVTATQAGASAPVKPKGSAAKVNSTTVVVEAEFRASADDLFSLLTDEKRIPAWTRAPAQSQGKAGTPYTLFGGGVKGSYVSLTPSKEIVQTWALQSPTWPSGHEATLTTTLEQSSESTKVIFSLAGVPSGLEGEIKRNLEGYYIHGFKSIGYVPLTYPTSVYTSEYLQKQKAATTVRKPRPAAASSSSITSYLPTVAIATLVLGAAFAIPYFTSSPPGASSAKATAKATSTLFR
ncbi:activator of Hsp90 ATPase [Crepidotus variabilis]|uniref:Activator of Hsp90 ATPase n=1 Tax=Crepidotus variabilis TaxID=179855 RepID=A0A9P6EN82_9AGAR|nr:activator of Hsp90 ATPase [Crepidotus variabilis]